MKHFAEQSKMELPNSGKSGKKKHWENLNEMLHATTTTNLALKAKTMHLRIMLAVGP